MRKQTWKNDIKLIYGLTSFSQLLVIQFAN